MNIGGGGGALGLTLTGSRDSGLLSGRHLLRLRHLVTYTLWRWVRTVSARAESR